MALKCIFKCIQNVLALTSEIYKFNEISGVVSVGQNMTVYILSVEADVHVHLLECVFQWACLDRSW